MKWKLLRLFFPVIIIGFVVPMITPGPDGKPLMSWRDWLPDQTSLAKLFSFVEGTVEAVDADAGLSSSMDLFANKKIYQWQDEQGRWHFTDNAESAAANAISKPMPEVQNFMVPLTLPDTKLESGDGVQSDFNFPATGLPINSIPQMLEDTRHIQRLNQQRVRQLEEI